MKFKKVSELFTVKYGNKFDANKMKFIEDGDINFISRFSKNNGCVGNVMKYNNIEPFDEGLITVSLGGSFLLSSFVQPRKFYTAQNIAILIPKEPMNLYEKLYYCKCISMNRFKYSAFGREANKTIRDLELPAYVPEWIRKTSTNDEPDLKERLNNDKLSLFEKRWKSFRFDQLFIVKKGERYVVSQNYETGDCPFVSASEKNNGIRYYLNIEPNHSGNTISVSYNGTIGEAFYQQDPYWATDDINVLYPNFLLNPFIAIFLITLIRKEKFKYSFGRKWNKERMEKSVIKLPVDEKGEPDWQFIENFVKTLKYSKELNRIHATSS